jgi:hypothetical protein
MWKIACMTLPIARMRHDQNFVELESINAPTDASVRYWAIVMAALLSVLLAGCADRSQPETITARQLVDNADEYQGQWVSVKGIAHYGFENCVLEPPEDQNVDFSMFRYSARHHYEIWYRNAGCMLAKPPQRSGLAIIEGRYNQDDGGHLGVYESTIEDAVIHWIED